ncbi:hypothetical protein [Sphingobium sp. CFD-2]|uniref:hypothetical protein n=1 Tax=Sphingobium sp. CFD-2 TaxID=2878542 RepID=UPI00214BC23F|nr:hypothetical protein [Sphingobium sp. CFD-2]
MTPDIIAALAAKAAEEWRIPCSKNPNDDSLCKPKDDCVWGYEQGYLAALSTSPTGQEVREVERLMHVIDRDRYAAAACVNAIEFVLHTRRWLREAGRGSYAYDDERYQEEFGLAFDEIQEALHPLRRLARDKSDCTRDEEKAKAARVAGAERFAALSSVEPAGNGREAIERFLADYDDGDRADAGTNPLMEAHIADFRATLSSPPAAEQEAVAYTGSGSLMALKDGREGFIWPTPADAHPIPLYATPPAPALDGVRAVNLLQQWAERYANVPEWSAKRDMQILLETRQFLSSPSEGESATVSRDRPSFEQVWATKEAEGYQYGEDALEQVRFGWELAVAALFSATSTERGR